MGLALVDADLSGFRYIGLCNGILLRLRLRCRSCPRQLLLLAGAVLLDAIARCLPDLFVGRPTACDTHAIICTRQLEALNLSEESLEVLYRRMQFFSFKKQQPDCL
jgi:hypothetical protein